MTGKKTHKEDLKVFGIQLRSMKFSQISYLFDGIRKLKFENKELKAKNKRLIQIINQEGIKEE